MSDGIDLLFAREQSKTKEKEQKNVQLTKETWTPERKTETYVQSNEPTPFISACFCFVLWHIKQINGFVT